MGEGRRKGEKGEGEKRVGEARRGKRGRRRRISPLPISQPNPSKIYSYSFFFLRQKWLNYQIKTPRRFKDRNWSSRAPRV